MKKGRIPGVIGVLLVLVAPIFLSALVQGCDHGYIYGGVTYWRQPVYRCYNVVVDYVWDYYLGVWRPVYQTVCRWESIAPVDIGTMDIAGEYQVREVDGERAVLARTAGSELAVGQVIKVTEGSFYSLIKVESLSEPWPDEPSEVGNDLPPPA